MEADPKESLNHAGDLIREGRTKPARAILLGILRDDPENAQAWFMISYTIPDLQKQISAAQQAVRLKPESNKARQRLLELGGDLLDTPQDQSEAEESEFLDTDDSDDFEPILPSASRTTETREPGDTDEDSVSEDELDALDALRSSVETYRQFNPGDEQEPDFTPRVDAIEKEVEEREKKAKVFGIPRGFFLMGAAGLVILLSVVALLNPDLRQAALGNRPTPTNAPSQPTAKPAKSTPTQDTSLPTNTPFPTDLPAPTISPANESLLAWDHLSRPTGIQQDKLNKVTAELLTIMGAQADPDIHSYSISEPELQGMIRSVADIPDFKEQVSNTHTFYQALGLASSDDDFDTLYANFWVDPNGTLAIPEEQSIAVIGYDFSDYQKYSYAQGSVQLLRYAQFPRSPLFQRSFPCFLPSEKCDIWNAILKGEAVFTANQWAAEFMSAPSLVEINTTNTKYNFTPFSPPATDFMNTLIESPYQIGYDFVEAVFEAEGWPGLDRIYNDPPKSTEQLIHPEKYLAGESPIGVVGEDLGDFLGSEWEPVFKGPLGEWKTYLLLTHNPIPALQLDHLTAQRGSAGWDGDLTQIYATESDQFVLLFHWLWETEGEQTQFNSIITQHASRMVGGLDEEINGFTCEKSTYQTSCIFASGLETIWLVAPDPDTATLVIENYSPISGE